jgi:hypothetical protein
LILGARKVHTIFERSGDEEMFIASFLTGSAGHAKKEHVLDGGYDAGKLRAVAV